MSCKVKFHFLKGPRRGEDITHEFVGKETVAQVKKFLIETHQACDASQALVFVWEEQGKKLIDEDEVVSSLGASISITVNVTKKTDSASTSPPPPLRGMERPFQLSLPHNHLPPPLPLSVLPPPLLTLLRSTRPLCPHWLPILPLSSFKPFSQIH